MQGSIKRRTCYNMRKYQLENKVVNLLIYHFQGTDYIYLDGLNFEYRNVTSCCCDNV